MGTVPDYVSPARAGAHARRPGWSLEDAAPRERASTNHGHLPDIWNLGLPGQPGERARWRHRHTRGAVSELIRRSTSLLHVDQILQSRPTSCAEGPPLGDSATARRTSAMASLGSLKRRSEPRWAREWACGIWAAGVQAARTWGCGGRRREGMRRGMGRGGRAARRARRGQQNMGARDAVPSRDNCAGPPFR
jgi:hypothetical protein